MAKVLGVDHIAIAVHDLDHATARWSELLGLRVGARETIVDQGVEVQMLHAGDTRIELLCPLDPDTPVGRSLAARGPGLHHLALAVDDCAATVDQLAAADAPLIDRAPREGAHSTRIAFLHPKALDGVLTEIVQTAADGSADPNS